MQSLSARHPRIRNTARIMKIAVAGANGQLGMDLRRALSAETIVPLAHCDLDVSDSKQVDQVLDSARPDVVINTAAFHKVEECEKEPETSFAVNAMGPRNLA